ncbi:aminotransferase class III-fold pyridoxal phosphate-dependent enzyme [Bacillus licheniformis]|nr:aminotransferase class III-fold pyridoxal phosphate-dependent enzyme [Bacillus licheniformis]
MRIRSFAPEVYQAPFPYYYRKPEGMTDESYDDMVIQAFDDFFVSSVAPETVACVVMEPVQGEGGLSFLQTVCAACRSLLPKHGIVLSLMRFKQALPERANICD